MFALKPQDIQDTRRRRGLTVAEAARLLNTSASTLAKWERGERQPRQEAARRLAEWITSPAGDKRTSTPCESRISIAIPPRLALIAEDIGADITELVTTVGMEAVRAELRRRWAEHTREAVEDQNAYFREHGVPLAKYRTW